ncbi:ABC transporter substrate-binding protein [Tsuneonella mangrovi]|uniref:ABC transporter substrate-binding protein n=1 Tax=Tsuneonella mangrovi TaxID=1982042 RepID=UPI000BA23EA0|nr:ABC transporter substrate-binding protein [Tsuneonella mangrovi]
MSRRVAFTLAACTLPALLSGCGSSGNPNEVQIAFIGSPKQLVEKGLRLSPPGQQVRAATTAGLVALDAKGEVVPALAERWIVTEDGLSYIFRVRDSDWPDGKPLTAEQVRDSLKLTLRKLRGTSLGLDLASISDIRTMTGRVIEIDLSSPVPDFLQLLTQPELGITYRGQVAGPMAVSTAQSDGDVVLKPMPPEKRGLPAQHNWEKSVRELQIRALPARDAMKAFYSGDVDVVFDGRLADLPLADTGPLSRGTVRIDAAMGLFGLRVLRDDGPLGDPVRREALAMAIDRQGLLSPFNVAGWLPSTRIIPVSLLGPGASERWPNLSLEQRRNIARERIAAWTRAGNSADVRISLPEGPGSQKLFNELAKSWAAIGVTAELVAPGKQADLAMVDALARFGGPRWFLDQFNCGVRKLLCSPEADALVREAVNEADPEKHRTDLLEAETRLMANEGFIPLGAPVRWSLVRGDVPGFAPNRWATHPLFPLAIDPK